MTIRPSSRSNGTGPARGDSRAGVTEVSGRRPGAGSSASEQTGEGAAPTRRRRAVRYDRQRPGHQQGADSATPAPQGAGSFYGRGGTRRRPVGQGSHLFSGPGEPVGDPRDGAAASGRPQPHLNTPHHNHKAPHLNRANHSPRLPSGERVSGREGRARGAVRAGARRASRASRGPRASRASRGPRASRASRVPRVPRVPRNPGHLGDPGCLGTPRRAGCPGYLGTRGLRAVEAVSRGPAKNAIIAQNDQKRPSKNRTTTTSAQMREAVSCRFGTQGSLFHPLNPYFSVSYFVIDIILIPVKKSNIYKRDRGIESIKGPYKKNLQKFYHSLRLSAILQIITCKQTLLTVISRFSALEMCRSGGRSVLAFRASDGNRFCNL